MKKIYINPVTQSRTKKQYKKPIFNTDTALLLELQKRGLDIHLGKTLKGGTVSQVYEAQLDGVKVIVKHTEDVIPFDPTEIFVSKEGHNIDSHILGLLQDSSCITVPRVIAHYPEITTTIMQDMREDGFTLMSSLLEKGSIPHVAASSIGKNLALFAHESKKWEKFKTNETPHESVYERGLELRLAYPNTQNQYLELEKEFTTDTDGYVWSDSHPKNMLINDQGKVAFIDFGRSHPGDQRFMLPNFLSHIALYALLGKYSKQDAITFMHECISAYSKHETVVEPIFCKYFAMEILHRANGKWLSGIETAVQKTTLYSFGLRVFDEGVVSIEELVRLLNEF